jgi:hypothetical protein
MALRRLNGWQRLWVIATVLWVIGQALYWPQHFPTDASNLKFWADSMAFHIKYEKYPNLSDEAAAVKAASDMRAKLGDEQFIEYIAANFRTDSVASTTKLYRSNQIGWWKHQADFVLFVALFALVPPALLYGLGLLVSWVRAGFRPPQAP